MKTIKMLVSLMLVFMMIFSMSSVALAADVTVTVDSRLNGHTFEAYQIFKGTEYKATPESATQLIDVKWGTGIDGVEFLAALKAEESFEDRFKDCADAADVAEALDGLADNSDAAKKFADLADEHKSATKTTITTATATLDSGYYLIVDTTNLEDKDGAKNAALLQVTGDITIAYKTDKPTVEKKVLEEDDYTTDGGYGVGYNDVADYCINEVVTYHLIGRVPDMSEYNKYEYRFVDEMDAALELDEDSIKVYLSSDKKVDETDSLIASTYYTDDATAAGFDVYFEDLKEVPGIAKDKYVIVEYKANVSLTAEPGLNGYLNGVHLKYSNNPDQGGLGKTEKDFVIVFTYELDVNKVDGETGTGLGGAKFVLYRGEGANKEYVQINAANKVTGWTPNKDDAKTFETVAEQAFAIIGLDAGTYYLEETVAPEGYNKLKEPIKLVIDATMLADAERQNWDEFIPKDALLKVDLTVDGKAVEPSEEDDDRPIGIVATKVENNQGTTLPETGGIGTTLFYIVGAALVLGAVVVLITRKRMN